MTARFSLLDWAIVAGYLAIIALAAAKLGRRKTTDARDYFLAGGAVPAWLAAISVLATTQSAATFLGGPDYGFRGDFTYLSANIGALLAAFVVARVFMPRFYAQGVTTVYELLGQRFGAGAMRAAGGMFLIGRVLAGGARLYLAAVAVSMLLFLDAGAGGVVLAAALLVAVAFLFTFHDGLRSIVWIDLIQFAVYLSAALALLLLLRSMIPLSLPDILHGLAVTPEGKDKLRLVNLSLDPTQPFALPAILTGLTLLNIGSFALDQDTSQRLLACRDAKAGARGLYLSVLAGIPVIAVFIAIGSLLYVVYRRPDMMGHAAASPAAAFHGADITVFMHFILTRAPPGFRGLAAVGVIATAVGTTMSALNAMSSVLIQDFYRPWRARAAAALTERHYVNAGRIGMGVMGLATFAMAVFSFYWRRYSDTPLLEFVLSVMNFAYAGLLGVYFTAVFTQRGSTASVIAALAVGFLVILVLQPYVADHLGLPMMLRRLAFPWQLCLGAAAAFATCASGRQEDVPA
jgi:SSS family solute:Na+ symporter